jgi:hypothetical protein
MNPNSIVAIGNVYFVHVDGAVGRICTNDGLDIALEGYQEGFRIYLEEPVLGN